MMKNSDVIVYEDVMMKTFNLFHAIGLSFFSRSFYQQVAKAWRFRSFAYLSIVLALAWLVVASFQTHYVCKLASQYASVLIPQLPVIHFNKGEAVTPAAEPVFVKWPNGNVFIIVDTKDQIKNFSNLDGTVLIQSRNYQVKIGHGQVKRYFYDSKTESIGPNEWSKMIHEMKNYFLWIVFLSIVVFGTLLSYVFWLLFSLVLSLVGWLVAIIFRRDIAYAGIYSLSLIVITPALFLWAVLDSLRISCANCSYVYWIVWLVYFLYAILVQPRQSNQK